MNTKFAETEAGLWNGAMGIIEDIVYKEGDTPQLLPVVVIINPV